jgi:D-alanyl-D-alanine carboxypeptidase
MLSRLVPSLLLVFALTSTALARSTPSEAQQARTFAVPPIRAAAALVMNAANGDVLAAKNPHLRLPMASTTKVMTALLALQLGHLTDRIRVPKAAFNYEWDATVMGLHPGQVVTLKDLLYGVLLPSGADAANTIAIHYAGSETRFVALMNHEAQVLGLHDTHYADDTGLTAHNHYTSAYDLAVLGQYVSYLPDFIKITSTKTYKWNGHVLQNINHVLFWYPGVDGLKPGYTNEAGLCQLIDVRRDGRHIVVAILNTPDLVIDARNLLNFGLRDYTWIQSALPGDRPSNAQTGTDKWGRYAYFPASGHYLRGAFWTAFNAAGGLAVLGYPRTEPLQEGTAMVQYFQNGALARSIATGKVIRLAIGTLATPLLPPTPTPTPTPRASPTPSPTPHEGTIVPGTPKTTPTPKPKVTPTPKAKVTPTPKPRVTPTPTPTSFPTAGIFQSFARAHARWLGSAVSAIHTIKGYSIQTFAYGALVTDNHGHVYLLPLGDRLLDEHAFLPVHPGNAYPAGFAPPSVLAAIGWLPAADLSPTQGHGQA